MKKILFTGAMSLLFILPALGNPTAEGTVNASSLNIRQQPGTGAAVVGKAVSGSSVTVLAANADWLKIRLPAGSEVFVAADYVKEGKAASRINVRSGPGTAYASYGLLPAGTEVTAIGEPVSGWQKIEPPEFAVGYVAARFVKVDAANLPKLEAAAVDKGGSAPKDNSVLIGVTVKDNDRPFDDLPVVEGSAREVTVAGVLVKVDSTAKNVPYALAVEKGGKYVVDCFIHTQGSKKFAAYVEKPVKLIGVRYKVPNWGTPVMRVIKLVPQE